MAHWKTVFVVLATVGALGALANGQNLDRESLQLTLAVHPETPTVLRIRVQNGSRIPVSLTVSGIGIRDHTVELRGEDGKEPERTGERPFVLSVRDVQLNPGEKLDQSMDLRETWDLENGRYFVTVERKVRLGESRLETLRAELDFEVTGESAAAGCSVTAVDGATRGNIESELLRAVRPVAFAESLMRPLEMTAARRRRLRRPSAMESGSLSAAFATAMRGVPGGLAITSDSVTGGTICMADAHRVIDGLEAMQKANSELRLDWKARVVNLLDARLSPFLETRIPLLRIPHPRKDPLAAMAAVLSAPEVQLSMQNLGVSEFGPISRVPTMRFVEEITLLDVTIREAFNQIVEQQGKANWLYREVQRDNRVWFSVTSSFR